MTKSVELLSNDKERLDSALKFIMEKEGIFKKDIADAIGMDSKTLSAQTTAATKKVQIYVVENIAKVYTCISKEWILFGSGEMVKRSNNNVQNYKEPDYVNHILLKQQVEYLLRENKILREMNELLKKQNDHNSK